MNATIKLTTPKNRRLRECFRPRRCRHDPMLALNMSIFNSGSSWDRIFNPIPQRENVWCEPLNATLSANLIAQSPAYAALQRDMH
jgi:hypothetical protein